MGMTEIGTLVLRTVLGASDSIEGSAGRLGASLGDASGVATLVCLGVGLGGMVKISHVEIVTNVERIYSGKRNLTYILMESNTNCDEKKNQM
jgi:hypothetical protein